MFRGLRRKEAMKEEGMGFHTSVLETRPYLCSLAKSFIKIGSKSKNNSPKALASLKTADPLIILCSASELLFS